MIHRENLLDAEVTAIEGIPVVTLERAVRESAAGHLSPDLLEQAVRHGRERGLLSTEQAAALIRDLGIDRLATVGA